MSSPSVGRLVVNITDAPPELKLDKVNLTVSDFQIHLADNQTGDGWQSLPLAGVTQGENVTFNLLDFQNGMQTLLADGKLTSGNYTQIRLYVEKVEILLQGDPEPKEAKLPSNVLKFVHPFEIIDGQDTVIVFDFDAAKSIHQTGKGEFMCKPVIKLTTTKTASLSFDAGITSDSVALEGTLASGYTIKTANVTGSMHVLGLIDTVANPKLADGDYGFTLQASGAQSLLSAYFAAKSWPANYLTQINDEISGAKPFFYLHAEGGVYTLVDSFKQAIGISPTTLTIDDDYPAGAYTYKGTLTGINGATIDVTIILNVTRWRKQPSFSAASTPL
jgi:hypothetical protein